MIPSWKEEIYSWKDDNVSRKIETGLHFLIHLNPNTIDFTLLFESELVLIHN